MKESVLNALVQLFAIIASSNEPKFSLKAHEVLKNFLNQNLNQKFASQYLNLFSNHLGYFLLNKNKADKIEQIQKLCTQINLDLSIREKTIIVLKLLEFSFIDGNISVSEKETISDIAKIFFIDENDFENLYLFLTDTANIKSKDFLVVDNKDDAAQNDGTWFGWIKTSDESEIKHVYREDISGQIYFLYLKAARLLLFKYSGSQLLSLQDRIVVTENVYIFNPGNHISGQKIKPIYYGDILSEFYTEKKQTRIVFSGNDVEYRFKGSNNGIYPFTFNAESGQMIGIMGGSGVGKSTLFHILSGKQPPDVGQITINGFDLYKNHKNIEGIIGYVPQDDLLFEELTVYQNLYFNACLCLGYLKTDQIKSKVDKLLCDLELDEIKNLTVGSPFKKIISGGQRKRLNIALELIREPYILFVDEPTSGLSSKDSEMMIHLLKEQTLKGKLVIINIHQPSSEVFKMFDKLWIMDKGGRIIYQGNPIEAIDYFSNASLKIKQGQTVCDACGNINAEQILEVVEEKLLDEYGRYSNQRKTTPDEWYQLYKNKIEKKIKPLSFEKKLPVNFFRIPDFDKQFFIMARRNFLTKINNAQYLFINLIEAPFLAFVLAYFSKYIHSGTYYFGDNKNIPAYFFMCVVVSLFLGMILSAEEIIKDKKIIDREKFLGLSRFSFINSKIIFLFALSALQMFLFVLIGNYILEIKGMNFSFWLILFSSACFANTMGLLVSSSLDSVVAVYITIPFILVPQILLSGTVVPFDNLHPSLTKKNYVPFAGDIMASRWAYEALMVEQFKNNRYGKLFYTTEQRKSNSNYIASLLIPRLEQKLEEVIQWHDDLSHRQIVENNLSQIRNAIKKITIEAGLGPYEYQNSLYINDFTEEIGEETLDYINYLKLLFLKRNNEAENEYDKMVEDLQNRYGKEYLIDLKRNYYNKSVADYVLNRWELNKIYELPDRLVQKKDPVFMIPESNFGRAHFYAPVKVFFFQVFDTFWFNITVIWMMSVVVYLILLSNGLYKIFQISRNSYRYLVSRHENKHR